MASSDQLDEMAAPTRASSPHGATHGAATSTTKAAGYTSYSSVNGTTSDPIVDAAGLNECPILNSSATLTLNTVRRQQEIVVQHSPPDDHPQNRDNRLVAVSSTGQRVFLACFFYFIRAAFSVSYRINGLATLTEFNRI